MTGKDFLKLLLLSYGFTKKIVIGTYRGDYNAFGYDIHAENDDGEYYNEVNCEGLMFNISNMINWMAEHGISPHSHPFPGREYSVNELLKMYKDGTN